MAGLHSSHKPISSYSPSSSHGFASRLLLLLTVLLLTLAAFAFILQWRGGFDDTMTGRWLPDDRHQFPGTGGSGPVRKSSSDCVNGLAQRSSPSFPYFRDWKSSYGSDLTPKICFISTTSASLEQILPWLFYHKVVGVSAFFLFVEGKAASPSVSRVLESIPGVKVIYRTKELEGQQAKRTSTQGPLPFEQQEFVMSKQYENNPFKISSSLSKLSSCILHCTTAAIPSTGFFYKPCNHELFVKQSLNMEMAIDLAREAGMDWIIHIDTDELLHPAGTPEYSLRQLLSDVPENIDMVVFPNYESSVERDDVKDPFSEVSMFKKNYDHLPKDTYFRNYKEATRGNPNYFLTYGNGKAAARIQDHLRPNGAHRWHNYMTTPNEIKLEEAAVLHYTYPKFSDLTSRRDRCGCKPTKKDVKRCFILDFDREAFIIASMATEEEMLQWYRERVVWTDEVLKLKLLKKGILTRIYAPTVIIRGLRESGIFSSIIESARASLSKDTFLSSTGSGNISRAAESRVISSRKIVGKTAEFQTTARKILDISGTDSAAIPPLPPPDLDNIHLDT